jgi:superfamily I DNA/RNA helicase
LAVGSIDEVASMEEARKRASDAVVESEAPKRLIVAGPGTGKTFTFKRALARAIAEAGGGRGVALTFIRNLVTDLERAIGDLADVYTFHGYCKHLMHAHVAGLQAADLYPYLLDLIVEDLDVTGRRSTSKASIDEHLHRLEAADGLVDDVMAVADYYAAVSFPDLVYRVLRHFEASPNDIPTVPLVVVDEYQDFSLLEVSFIELLATKNSVLVAGDDDQALYSSFRYASPDYIRDLANGGTFERFELPYCSRCTDVIVEAVKDTIREAEARGNLKGRLEKDFLCYLPDKAQDSEDHPQITHVECSTFMTAYAGEYIAQQISLIPPEDIERSRKEGYPTVLVIGPDPFRRKAFEVVSKQYPGARNPKRQQFAVDILDGYERIARDAQSRLGWRVVISCTKPKGWKKLVKQALDEDKDLSELLDKGFRNEHLSLAGLVGNLVNDGALSADDEARLADALHRDMDEIRDHLNVELTDDPAEIDEESQPAEGEDEPDILFTTLVGAKGLSAEHVFVVGANEGYIPGSSKTFTDEEICKFLVALSRTRQQCHLISYKWFIKGPLRKSAFLDWIKSRLSFVKLNKDYDFTSAG